MSASQSEKPEILVPGRIDVNLQLKTTIPFGSIIFFVASALIVFYYWSVTTDIGQILDFSVKSLGVAAGVTSALYVGDNIRYSAMVKIHEESLRKTDRALDFISCWNNPSFNSLKEAVSKITSLIDQEGDSTKHPGITKKALDEDSAFRESARDILNFLEEISMAIEKDLADETILKEFFVTIFRRYYFIFKTYIDQRREKFSEVFKYFLEVNHRWNRT